MKRNLLAVSVIIVATALEIGTISAAPSRQGNQLVNDIAAFIDGDEEMFGFTDVPNLASTLTLGPLHYRLVPTDDFYLGNVTTLSGLQPDNYALVVVYQSLSARNVVLLAPVGASSSATEPVELGTDSDVRDALDTLAGTDSLINASAFGAFFAYNSTTGLVRPIGSVAETYFTGTRTVSQFAGIVSTAYAAQFEPNATPVAYSSGTPIFPDGRSGGSILHATPAAPSSGTNELTSTTSSESTANAMVALVVGLVVSTGVALVMLMRPRRESTDLPPV